MSRVISNSSIPDCPCDDTHSNTGKISEAPTTVPGIYDQEVVTSDAYVNMELGLPWGSDNELVHALVKRRKLNNDGKPIGTEQNNLLINTIAYRVEFIDDTTETLTAAIIAKKLLDQVDEECHRQLPLDKILDY